MTPNNITQEDEDRKADLDAAVWRLGPSMAQAAAETAAGFLGAEVSPASDWTAVPRLPDFGVLRCSQRNVGERLAMTVDLSVEKAEWRRLFTSAEDEGFREDAFREMANCICGSITSDSAFTGEFGYLLPTVPQAFPSRPPKGARSYHGAFRLGGAWILFSIAVHRTAGSLAPAAMMAA